MPKFFRILWILIFLSFCLSLCGQEVAPGDPPDFIYPMDRQIQLPVPDNASAGWAILDHDGKLVKKGRLNVGEETLYFDGLTSGVYYFFHGLSEAEVPNERSSLDVASSFLLVAPPDALPEDHFFAVAFPHAASFMEAGTAEAESLRFLFRAMPWLGIHRLRTHFGPRYAPVQSVEEGVAVRDWSLLDRLVGMAEYRKVRFIAVLDDAPEALSGKNTGGLAPALPPPDGPAASAESDDAVSGSLVDDGYAKALMRHFGFKLDEFTLWPQPNREGRFFSARQWIQRLDPVYTMIKRRNRFASVSLGGLDVDKARMQFAGSPAFLDAVFHGGAPFYDVIDIPAPGNFQDSKKLALDLQKRSEASPANRKARAVSAAAIPPSQANIAGQYAQASDLLKKIVWYRFHNYRYFTLEKLSSRGGETSGLFAADPETDNFYPRMTAAVWLHAISLLGNAKALEDLGHASEKSEIYAFEQYKKTIFVGWMPLPNAPSDNETRRIAVTLLWPDEARARVLDILGKDITSRRYVQRAPGKHDVILTEEPVFIVVNQTGDGVGW